ncbi:DUF262 domain-containing protein [Paenibacillus sp. MSJ-34]|uniref:DUF262 domain-containing protein n=1 Tax=Paenibacillus sp. MSJ-34 TaxID=2841529 RepID=UPI001C0F986B|nr:DUF262 domain-containing protein [Paenibacillus sp. MSJ-34]MBU5442323.1 DUF262 domain-containing protein [Paenibacillus sp. MSJ-34]
MTNSANNMQRKLIEIEERLRYSSEPAYVFKRGDKVQVGNFHDAIVEEVLHDGKTYLIDYTEVSQNYGDPIRREHQKGYFSWVQVRKYQEEQPESMIQNTDLNLRFSYRMLIDLINRVYHYGVNFDPEYQRGYVWEPEDKVKLVESVFSNIDIGKFAFIQYDTKTWVKRGFGYEILDGKQRLRAIIDYYEDRFRWRGKTFSELSPRDRNHFLNYPVIFAEPKGLSREQTLRYFILLNTVGKSMSQEQLDQVKALLEEGPEEA